MSQAASNDKEIEEKLGTDTVPGFVCWFASGVQGSSWRPHRGTCRSSALQNTSVNNSVKLRSDIAAACRPLNASRGSVVEAI